MKHLLFEHMYIKPIIEYERGIYRIEIVDDEDISTIEE